MPASIVFVHSYQSTQPNWHDVVFGSLIHPGRVRTALAVAKEFDAPLIADESFDEPNQRLYRRLQIKNLTRARTTQDEVRNFLDFASKASRKIFVTSPDHLPRVARDALALGASNTFFAAYSTPYTETGPRGVVVEDRPDDRGMN